MNVYLVGYRCSGKTSLGRLLAERLNWGFVDTDALIIARAGQEIAAIVAAEGWGHFRQLEQACLVEVSSRPRQVVATGGGIVLDTQNVKAMQRTGVVVWLTAAADALRKRMVDDDQTENQRPALTDRNATEEIEMVLEERNPLYRTASDIEMDTGLEPVQVLVQDLVSRLSAYKIKPDRTL